MLNPPEPLRKTKTKGEIKMMRDKRWEDRKRGITCAVSKIYVCVCVCVRKTTLFIGHHLLCREAKQM